MMPEKTRGSARYATPARVVVENVNVPGDTTPVDAEKSAAVRVARWRVVSQRRPGIARQGISGAVVPHIPQRLFPGGATASWWAKTVRLDLEATGVQAREASRPLCSYRPPSKLWASPR
jgi:hypothetical protein